MYSVNIQERCLKIVIWRKRCCRIWPTCLSEISNSEGRWRPIYLFFYKKQRPAMANSNKSPLQRSESAGRRSGLSCMAMIKRAWRHVRIGVAVPELCMRTSHMTYQCSPECNQTWTRIYLLLILQLGFFFFFTFEIRRMCQLCACVSSGSGGMTVLTVSIWKQEHAFSRPKTFTKVLHKA